MDRERLARIAYSAYEAVTNFKNYQGNPMPEFDALPEKIKEAWVVACEAVVHELFGKWHKNRQG